MWQAELPEVVQGVILVTFKEGVEPQKIEDILGDFKYRKSIPEASPDVPSEDVRYLSRLYRVNVLVGEEQQVIHDLRLNHVEYIESAERIPIRYAHPRI